MNDKLKDARQDREAFEAWSAKAQPKLKEKIELLAEEEIRRRTQAMVESRPAEMPAQNLRELRSIVLDFALLEAWAIERKRRGRTG